MPNAIRIHETGGPEVMRWGTVDLADPASGEVRVRHTAVGLNYIDTYHRSEQGLGVTHSRLEFGLVWSSVQALEPGTWTLQLGVDGYRTWRQPGAVLARETTRVVVEMVPE